MEVKISDLLPDADISGLPAPVQADPNRVREAVMGKLKEEHMQTTKRTRKIRRTLVLAVAAAALLGVTALAAAMGGFDWLRETVDPLMLDAVEEQGAERDVQRHQAERHSLHRARQARHPRR